MESAALPASLAAFLGDEPATALKQYVTEVVREECDAVRSTTLERVERRLAEVAGLRTDISELKGEMRSGMAELRAELRADFRVEIASVRVDVLRWSFLFWVSQLGAILAALAFLTRTTGAS